MKPRPAGGVMQFWRNITPSEVSAPHLVYERAQQGVASLAAQETLRVVQEGLVEAVEDVLQQQAALLLAIVLGVEEQRLCKKQKHRQAWTAGKQLLYQQTAV